MRTVYAGADLPNIDMNKLAYFGASIFWRACLNVWTMSGKRCRFIDLGPYAEPLRQFLLREREFPPEMVLWSAVCRTPNPPPVMSIPSGGLISQDDESFYMHSFDIPGLSYMLYVGRSVPENKHEFCMIRSPRRILYFSPFEDLIIRRTARVFSKSPPSSSLRKLHRKVTGEEL